MPGSKTRTAHIALSGGVRRVGIKTIGILGGMVQGNDHRRNGINRERISMLFVASDVNTAFRMKTPLREILCCGEEATSIGEWRRCLGIENHI